MLTIGMLGDVRIEEERVYTEAELTGLGLERVKTKFALPVFAPATKDSSLRYMFENVSGGFKFNRRYSRI